MSIQVRAGEPFEASVQGFDPGLVGVIGVRVDDGQGGAAVIRTAAGIVETANVDGLSTYTATIPAAPPVPGQYWIVWDDGTDSATESLVVIPAGFDLCTLAQVRQWLQKAPADTSQDAAIQSAISRASRAILTYAEREFVPMVGNPATRTFIVGGAWKTGVLRIGDLAAAPTAVVVRTRSGQTVATLSVVTDVEPGPAVRWPGEPITELTVLGGVNLDGSHRVAVTGTWGFPSVPEDVQQAAIVTAGNWVRRYVQGRGTGTLAFDGSPDDGVVESLPAAARALLAPYRMPVLA
ncbi:MAG TPA: hypothetical protein VNT51_05855 [Miltoncostaeaceae bacterium]|nr:hypothetical protein [Miltoncostaeaceae bacterium]